MKARAFVDGQALGRERTVTLDPAALLTRTSGQLKGCTDKVTLRMIDDAPAAFDKRAMFTVDILEPCWIWQGADLSKGAQLTARVGQLPFNFQVGKDRDKIPLRAPATPEGELEVRLGCDGERIAAIPLGKAVRNPQVSTITGRLPAHPGKVDLCLSFTAKSVDPYWVIDRVTLKPAP